MRFPLVERDDGLAGHRERWSKRDQIEVIGGREGHRRGRFSWGRCRADADLTSARCRAGRCGGQDSLHLAYGASSVAGGVVDHHITAGLLDGEHHSAPLPKSEPKPEDAEDQRKYEG